MITSSMIIMVLTFNKKIPVIMARTMFAPGILWACGAKIRVSGKENLLTDESYVFVSNHLSFLDIPTLFFAIPHNLYFVAKKQIKNIPFIGWYMIATGMIFVDRTNRVKSRESMDKAGKLIKKGKDVLIFPEGTRSENGDLGPFKKGAFALASSADVAVVPVAIAGTEKVMAPGQITLMPHSVEVVIGKPQKIGKMDLQTFTEVHRNNVEDLIGSMRN